MTSDDELLREPLDPRSRPPHPPLATGRAALLAALAALLVLIIVGTTALVVRDLHLSQSGGALAPVAATATRPSGSPTPTQTPDNRSDPLAHGWTLVSGGTFADVQFTPGSGQRGYLCGMDTAKSTRLVGVTTDGGNTWQIGPSPAGYDNCSLQVSATNPLDVVLLSNGRCGGCGAADVHYSTDGGRTWKTPFPANTQTGVGAVWAGTYLYIWADPPVDTSQSSVLKVSVNGGAFTTLDANALVPGASGVFIQQVVAGGTAVYITVAYNGCSSTQGCTTVVASADGGKTWSRVSDTFNMHVVWVAGGTLYGAVVGPQASGLQTSTDNGASWKPLALPPLPDGTTVEADIPSRILPTADGTVFGLVPELGIIAYLHAGKWTVLPFSSYGVDGPFGTISFGRDGRPARVWVFSDLGPGSATSLTLYRHDMQFV